MNPNLNNSVGTVVAVSFLCLWSEKRKFKFKLMKLEFCVIFSLSLVLFLFFEFQRPQSSVENVEVPKNVWPIVIMPDLGILKGRLNSSPNCRFYEFRGIKYAKAPSGPNRFKAPIPVEPWNGIKSAENYSQNCSTLESLMQLPESERNSSELEDCLSLDVYTSNIDFVDFKSNQAYPVMVYVHGGSFRSHNSPDFLSNYFMKRKIVLVVINYRLDSLGK